MTTKIDDGFNTVMTKKNKKFKPSKHKTVENLVILKDVLETTSKIKN